MITTAGLTIMGSKARKRPAISDGMKYRSLKLHGQVLVQCNACVARRLRMEAKGIKFEGDSLTTWHKLNEVQFDHVWELADHGKHGAKHLRPLCIPCHKEKSARSEKMRHHLDRASKKARGVFKRKSPPMQSRGFQVHPTHKRTVSGKVVER
jgi:hypothetical protein